MNNYQDRLGFFHDKAVQHDGTPSSNNGIFYTAIAHKLGIVKELTSEQRAILADCASRKIRYPDRFELNVPLSREEAMALEYFGFNLGWYFHHTGPAKFNLWLFLIQAFHCFDPHHGGLKHRNTAWQNHFTQIYRVMFMSPYQDRSTILKFRGKFNLFYWLIHLVAHIGQPEHRSSRLLRWVKTNKDIDAIANYFTPDHPFVARVKELKK